MVVTRKKHNGSIFKIICYKIKTQRSKSYLNNGRNTKFAKKNGLKTL